MANSTTFSTIFVLEGREISRSFETPTITAREAFTALGVEEEYHYLQIDTKEGSTWLTRLLTEPGDQIDLRDVERINIHP